LNATKGFKLEDQAAILKDCLLNIEEKIRIKKEKEDAWLRKKEERRLLLEDKLRIHNYKPVRFKKPLKPLEERRQYTRCCRRCDEYYRTFAKHGTICDGCKKKGVNDGVPHELNNLVK
jgi:hypothetical protein